MSRLARLQEELEACQSEIHEREAAVESIRKITDELEAQKKAVEAKAAELNGRQNEVTAMQTRVDALIAAEPAINAAMRSKSSTTDVVVHVLEQSIRSDHLTASDTVRLALGVTMRINGRNRGDNIEDLLVDLIKDQEGLKAAIESAMASFAGVNDVVKCALATALEHGAKADDLTETVAKTVYDMLGKTTPAEPIKETPIGIVAPSRRLLTLKLMPQCPSSQPSKGERTPCRSVSGKTRHQEWPQGTGKGLQAAEQSERKS